MEDPEMVSEIMAATAALVAQHSRKAMVAEFTALTGLGAKIFDCYKDGTRNPTNMTLYYLAHEASEPMAAWAAECLAIRARYGEGLPVVKREV